ncbi:16S rRNA (guanine(966)-N(2))-methyltransferase RsmD [Labedaea rhizosphaerae]|uniref:16S rRNA (guanine(966)-N(2))-methyltransferase RsmD n=1 Tax=Labedaea rhizosphaerae TaxID=598644 RepID=UPI0010623275|nr:16S rRNA (guanine(966)-N(2))-methyltransferase RsmD [Labedaea rhizosphaerae]
MTRIVAGVAGGRRLTVPPRGTRPTSERVREALFSAIEAAVDLDGARVLDLYAGSGALGLEALSRGAAAVSMVERDRNALAVLRRNIGSVGLPGAEAVPGAVGTVLARGCAEAYDLVLADPPYAVEQAELTTVLTSLAEHGWVADGSLVIVERAKGTAPDWPDGFEPLRSRRYGDTEVHWANVVAGE